MLYCLVESRYLELYNFFRNCLPVSYIRLSLIWDLSSSFKYDFCSLSSISSSLHRRIWTMRETTLSSLRLHMCGKIFQVNLIFIVTIICTFSASLLMLETSQTRLCIIHRVHAEIGNCLQEFVFQREYRRIRRKKLSLMNGFVTKRADSNASHLQGFNSLQGTGDGYHWNLNPIKILFRTTNYKENYLGKKKYFGIIARLEYQLKNLMKNSVL